MTRERAKSLGRGLSSLLGEEAETEEATATAETQRTIPVEYLRPSRFQPRRAFDEDAIADLAESIRLRGVLQPILVRPLAGTSGAYEIIAGERRWRAAQKAQLHDIPVIIRELSDQEALEVALVENLQRQDLSPLEEAEGYNRLMEDFSHTQEKLAQSVGKSRSHVANMMRLLSLPDPVKGMLDTGALTVGHARALLGCAEAVQLAEQVAEKGLNVRQTEKLAQAAGGKAKRPPKAPQEKDADTIALERDLSNLLGLRVTIQFNGRGGDLSIHYDSLEQLDDILHRLNHAGPASPEETAPKQEEEADTDSSSLLDVELDLDSLLGEGSDDGL